MKKRFAPIVLALLVIAGISQAGITVGDTFELKYAGMDKSRNVKVSNNGRTSNVSAGLMKYGIKDDGQYSTEKGFCIDFNQHAKNSYRDYEAMNLDATPVPGNGMGTEKAGLISKMWASSFDLVDISRDNAAAFQVAVWEIINDSDYSLSNANGDFYLKGYTTIANIANTMIQTALNYTGPMTNLVALSNNCYQDYIVEGSPLPPTPASVPTPGALLMATIGGSFVAYKKRKNHAA